MNTKLLSYLAGAFDGEGAVAARFTEKRSPPQMDIRLSLGNTDYRLPMLFERSFGGKCFYQAGTTKWRSQLDWRVTGSKAGEVAKQLVLFSVIKKEQLELFIQLSDTIIGPGRAVGSLVQAERKRIMEQLHTLQKGEWEGEEEFAQTLLLSRLDELQWKELG